MKLPNLGIIPSFLGQGVLTALALLFVLSAGVEAQQNCQLVWAQNVLGHFDGNNQQSNNTDSNDALGDTGSTYFSMGLYGEIKLDFGADFTTSGDSAPDFCVRDLGDDDCVFVCLFPANAATAQALLAAGMTENNGYYEFNTAYCGNFDLDLDALIPGHTEGELLFSKVLLIDNCATSDGTELEQVCALVCTSSTPPTNNCQLVWAQSVVNHSHGSNQESDNDDEDDVLGNTPNSYYSLGRSGKVAVAFGSNFTTSGNSDPDVCVREDNNNDCYYVCLFPADAATASALSAAGMSENNGYYEFSVTYCGDIDLDLDNLIPGYNEGELQFSNVLILDDGSSGNGAEIEQVCGLVCTNVPTPPTENCVLVWAQNVVSHAAGNNQESNFADPMFALGDTPSNYFSLGRGGRIAVDFGANFTTSGNSDPDICVGERSDNDCYYVCLFPADTATASALAAAGMSENNGYYEFSVTYCGNIDLDLDNLIPGHSEGELQFSNVLLLDDNSSGDGAEIEQVCALVCNTTTDCVITWADNIIDFMVGANPWTGGPDENSILGDTPMTLFSLGDGGYITLGFGANFTTSGNGAFDICIDEYNVPDCYSLYLKPASGSTFLALQDAGLTAVNGAFELPAIYCSDNEIDLDALLPGFAAGELQFASLTIIDDGAGGNGAEIYRVCTLVCDPADSTLAELGDCVFVDADCNGILDSGEIGKQHVTVVLIRPSDGAVVDFTMTGADGKYRFTNIIPGDYLVVFSFNEVSYEATLADVGNDDEVDSDFDPTIGFVPITLGPGEVNNSLDFGVCEICVGPPATQFSRPCGFDPINDPVLESTLLIPGEPITLTLTSNFPGQLSWIYYSLGNIAPITYMGCTFSLDVLNTGTNLGIAIIAPADENGVLTFTTPDTIPVGFDGFTVIFQGRVCAIENGPPGPFAPLPDFFSNGLVMTIGCP